MFFNIGMSGSKTLGAVDVADFGLDACRVAEGTKEFVGGKVGEPDTIHAAALAEDKFACVEGENGITNPCSFALNFEKFVTGHEASVCLGSWLGKFLPLFVLNSPT